MKRPTINQQSVNVRTRPEASSSGTTEAESLCSPKPVGDHSRGSVPTHVLIPTSMAGATGTTARENREVNGGESGSGTLRERRAMIQNGHTILSGRSCWWEPNGDASVRADGRGRRGQWSLGGRHGRAARGDRDATGKERSHRMCVLGGGSSWSDRAAARAREGASLPCGEATQFSEFESRSGHSGSDLPP